MRENNIFKIQVPLNAGAAPVAFVYNHDRTVERFIPIDSELLWAMDGEPKKYFYGRIDLMTRELVFEREAPWQEW